MSIETPTAPISRLDSVQALRGLAAIAVVATHLWVIERKYNPDALTPEWFAHGAGGVDLFFVISGFIMVYVTRSAKGGIKGISEFLFARIGRIYPLYWIVSLALLAVWYVRPEIVFSSYDEPNLLKSFLLWPDVQPDGKIVPPLLLVGWTLIHEMGFYIVFALSLLFSRKFLPLFLTIWGAFFIAGNLSGWEKAPYAFKILFNPLTAEFLLGAIAALLILKWNKIPSWLWLALAGLCAILFPLFIPIDYAQLWTRVLIFGLPSTFLLLGISSAEISGKWKTSQLFVWLGDWSYALYLTHVLTLSLIGRIWAIFSREGLLDNFVMIPLMIVASIIVAALTYILIERPLIRAVKKVRKRIFAS